MEFEALVRAETERQNLVSQSTLEHFRERHIRDSAQLVHLASDGQFWADVGSGAGLPGVVTAILTGAPTTLIEPRRLRADFLLRVAGALELDNVSVVAAKAERTRGSFDVITARAVAPAVDLLGMTAHLAHSGTRYLLMKGRTAQKELEEVRKAWQGRFRLVASVTDPAASILVAEGVQRMGRKA